MPFPFLHKIILDFLKYFREIRDHQDDDQDPQQNQAIFNLNPKLIIFILKTKIKNKAKGEWLWQKKMTTYNFVRFVILFGKSLMHITNSPRTEP